MFLSYSLLALVVAAVLLLLGLMPVYPLQSRKDRASLIVGGNDVVFEFSGTGTGGSPIFTAIADTSGVRVGDTVYGSNLTTQGGLVLSKTSSTVTLDNNAVNNAVFAAVAFRPPSSAIQGLNGQSFRLFKADFTPTVGTVLADLTAIEADFAGYAAKTLAMTTGYVDPVQVPISQSQLLSFIATDAVTPNSVYGWWIDDGTNVIAAAKFNVLVPMDQAGRELSGVLADGYPPGAGWQPLVPANA